MQQFVVSALGSNPTAAAASPVLEMPPSASKTRASKMKLCSRTKGRERWHADILENNPRLAAAVELILQTEEGISEAHVNPLTGRVLVRYTADALRHPVERLLRQALDANPLTNEEFSLFRSRAESSFWPLPLLTAKGACCLAEMILLGGLCPFGFVGAALVFLTARSGYSARPLSVRLDYNESAVTN
jgi:hypothetical protein